MPEIPNILVIGAGEYVTGFGRDHATHSDKSSGVILLSLLELRRQQRIAKITLCAQDGRRFPLLRAHLQAQIDQHYSGLLATQIETLPSDDCSDAGAWKRALAGMKPGDLAIVATPDHLHFEMAVAAQQQGLHVLVVKPLVQLLTHHLQIVQLNRDTLMLVEMHKRLDPFYEDARERARELGDFSYMHSYMSQPKSQLQTFQAWAGAKSDISYYLNSHHIDIHAWIMAGLGRPVSVCASASFGVGTQLLSRKIEDVITLKADWENLPSGNHGVAIYTASWIAPEAEVHSQQRFFYLAHQGELAVDQAHRGYHVTTDEAGYLSPNPLFMQYREKEGHFAGTSAYGFRSIEQFVARAEQSRGHTNLLRAQHSLPTAAEFLPVTAILEAGRKSLDCGGLPVDIVYGGEDPFVPTSLTQRGSYSSL